MVLVVSSATSVQAQTADTAFVTPRPLFTASDAVLAGAFGIATVAAAPADRYFTRELQDEARQADRKSTRLNSSHSQNSYAVFCLKKKTPHLPIRRRSPPREQGHSRHRGTPGDPRRRPSRLCDAADAGRGFRPRRGLPVHRVDPYRARQDRIDPSLGLAQCRSSRFARRCEARPATPAAPLLLDLVLRRVREDLHRRAAFFFNATPATEIYTLSLHDALPI